MEKSHYKIVKLEFENFDHLSLNTRVNLLHRRRAHLYNKWCKNVWYWVGRWVDGWVVGWMVEPV